MIRHSNSLLISLVIHAFFLLVLFFVWQSYSETKKLENSKICLKLCSIESREVKKTEVVLQKESKEIIKPQITVQNELKKEDTAPVKTETQDKIAVSETVVSVVEVVPEKFAASTKSVIKEKAVQTPLEEQQEDSLKPKQDEFLNEYMKINSHKITQLLRENLYYPMSARKRNITGLVNVKFTLSVDAKVYDIKIIESNSDILSRAATKTLEDLSQKFPKPKEEVTLSIPIDYKLN